MSEENSCHNEGSHVTQTPGPLYEELQPKSILEHRGVGSNKKSGGAYKPTQNRLGPKAPAACSSPRGSGGMLPQKNLRF